MNLLTVSSFAAPDVFHVVAVRHVCDTRVPHGGIRRKEETEPDRLSVNGQDHRKTGARGRMMATCRERI
jgi:hypothetical protein